MKLWQKILIGMALGVATGLGLRLLDMLFGWESVQLVDYLKPIGDQFIRLVKMLVVLLIFSSLTIGITSIHDPQKLGRVGLKTLALYFLTTLVAIAIGMTFAQLIKPGLGVDLTHAKLGSGFGHTAPSLSTTLQEMIPDNPIGSLAEGNVLQIIVFSVFLGLAINFSGEKARPLLNLLESVADVMYRLTSIVMEFAPYGAYASMAWAAGAFGLDLLLALAEFLLCIYLACTVHVFLTFGVLLIFVAKVRPYNFFRGMGDAMALAFSTSSSSAALPVTMHCVQENLGVSKNISSFVLPLGATVNMNGTAIYQGITALFIAQANGIELGWAAMGTIMVTASLSAIGAAGIPGTGFTMMGVVLDPVGLPKEGLSLVLGVDRLREMFTTVVNILGDSVVAVQIARSEGELNEDQYYHTELVELEEEDEDD